MQCVREDNAPLTSCYYLHPLTSAEMLLVPQSLIFGGSSGILSAAGHWMGTVIVDDDTFTNKIGKEF